MIALSGKSQNNVYYKNNKTVVDKITFLGKRYKKELLHDLLYLIERLDSVKKHRFELWYLLSKSAKKYMLDSDSTFYEVVKNQIAQYKILGRLEEKRAIGRIRLVKGLEYDHVVVFGLDDFFDPREVYVAITRARKTLTIFTKNDVLTFKDFNFPKVLLK